MLHVYNKISCDIISLLPYADLLGIFNRFEINIVLHES